MSRKKKRGSEEEISFWQPASDMLSGLLLILMLVILLLGLYLVHIPEYDQPDPYIGAGDKTAGDSDDGGASATPTPTYFFMSGGGDGGGGVTPAPTTTGWGSEPTVSPSVTPTYSPTPTVSPTPDLPGSGGGSGGGEGGGNGQGEGPGEEPDVGMKSAVYVMLVDAETDRTIKEANVEFELYGADSALQILNTYYPERITYRTYETTEAGTFYFPEKLFWGAYELHELTEPEGYDAAENVPFLLDAMYDWPEPLVVRVPVYPSRNIVRVQMTDAETGRPVSGGTFEVVAAENIITADGTLRYRKDQVVCLIECGEDGYGESEEIYLGNYELRQKDIPEFYAGMLDTVSVSVEKKSKVLPPVSAIDCERTRMRVTLADELYPARGIAGVSYRVSTNRGGADPFEIATGSTGDFVLDELDKGVTYRLRQVAPAAGYQPDEQSYTFTVSADGRISGEPEAELQMTNRMIRVQVGITDEFSSVQVPGVSLALYSQDGQMIRTWTTSGSPLTLSELQPGSYYLIKDGDTESHYDVYVRDQAEIQSINIHTTYVLQYVLIGVSAAVGLALVGAVTALIIRRRRRRAGGKS